MTHENITKHGSNVRDTKVDPKNGQLLVVSLPAIKTGKYRVTWRVVSVDTHVTNGSFEFEVTG